MCFKISKSKSREACILRNQIENSLFSILDRSNKYFKYPLTLKIRISLAYINLKPFRTVSKVRLLKKEN